MPVYVLAQSYIEFQGRGIDPEVIRDEFECYKAGDPDAHEWFAHDRGANPGEYLRHVHFIPSDKDDEAKWMEKFAVQHRRKDRTSDSYVIYASDPRHGHLIVDILDDPGAHDLWKNRRTKLAPYELAAANFCIYGFNAEHHK